MTLHPRALFAPAFGIIAGLTGLLLATTAHAAGIDVGMDQGRILTFDGPVKTVFVGNSAIADVTVIDPNHVVILGRNFGTTNVVALDAKGRETLNQQVTVMERTGSAVTLQRGTNKSTLNCNPTRCETTPTPGDDPSHFIPQAQEVDKREDTNVKAVSGR